MLKRLYLCLALSLLLGGARATAQSFGRGLGFRPAPFPHNQFFGARPISPNRNRFFFPHHRGFFPQRPVPLGGHLFRLPNGRPLYLPPPIAGPAPFLEPFISPFYGYGYPYPFAYGAPYTDSPYSYPGWYEAPPSFSRPSTHAGHDRLPSTQAPSRPSPSAEAPEASEGGKLRNEAPSSGALDPRAVIVTLDGQEQPSLSGIPLTVGSGTHTVRISAKPAPLSGVTPPKS